ncbi:MAG TPA: DUF6221 family protein [Streptosporangiaceae bacterium]|nr:DUF6221 family protein [Streptosporangiaceae bacterium]
MSTGDRHSLAAFVTARLDEDEAMARAAPGEHWRAFAEESIAGASVYDEQWVLLYPERYDHDNKLSVKPGATGPQYIERARDEMAAHIARHDPARVLREVTAGRRILELHLPDEDSPDADPDEPRCQRCQESAWPCSTLRALAAIWSDHPDYDPAWA